MILRCRNCGVEIPAEKINVQTMVAVCPACNEVFNFDGMLPARKSRKLHQPSSIQVNETASSVDVSWPVKPQMQGGIIAGSIVVTIVFLTMFAALVLTQSLDTAAFLASIVGFLLPGLGCAYYAAALALSRHHIYIDDEQIRLSTTPLPLFDGKRLEQAAIQRFEVKEIIDSTEGHVTYRVLALMEDGLGKVVLKTLSEQVARFVAQILNENTVDAHEVDEQEIIPHQDESGDFEAELSLNQDVNGQHSRLR